MSMNLILKIMTMKKVLINNNETLISYMNHLIAESEVNALGIGNVAELPNQDDNFSESDESDKEDEIIKEDDNLILVGRVDGDASILEVFGNTDNQLFEFLKNMIFFFSK